MKTICGIYKITSPNKKIYIGQSKNIERRKNEHKKENKKQYYLCKSIKKYGWDKHKFEIIEQCLESELNEKEKYYIELFQTFNYQYGMNLKEGGNRCVFSDETRKKMSVTRKLMGIKPPSWLGKKHSLETIAKISNSNKGKIFTKEHRKNLSNARKGIIVSQETREKMRKKMMGNKYGLGRKDNLGKKLSNETKLKISISLKKWYEKKK